MARLNPPVVLTFGSAREAREHLNGLHFRRLPTGGPIQRWSLESCDDDGDPILIFASSVGRNDRGEVVKFLFEEFERKERR